MPDDNQTPPGAQNPDPTPIPTTPPPPPKPVEETPAEPVAPAPVEIETAPPAAEPAATPPEEQTEAATPEAEPEPVVSLEPAEPQLAEEEVIQGAPAKPGDKPEEPEQIAVEEQDVPASTEGDSSVPPQRSVDPQPKTGFKTDGVTPLDGEEKVFAGLGYVGILALLPLLARRESDFAQHHGRQGLVVAVAFIFLWLLSRLSYSFAILVFILQIVAIVGGFVLAYKGDWFRIPGLYDLSLNLKFKPKPEAPKAAPPSENPE